MLDRLLCAPLIFACRLYQRLLSPLLGNNCRFHPTCSDYAIEALKTRGFFVGLFLAVRRILRCNSLFEGGEDPLPPAGPSSL